MTMPTLLPCRPSRNQARPLSRALAPARGIALLLLFPAAAAACTRSATDLGPDQIATQVAATLSAIASPPPSGGLATWTPPPSATIPPTATQTQTPTATIGPSATPTVPPLPTDDPRYGLNLSAPNYTDDFSQRFLWYEFSDPTSATNLWQEGTFHATDHVADSFIWWSTSVRSAGDVYVEVTAEVGVCSGKDGSGLALRAGGDNFDQGYSLEFACDGTYRIRKWISGQAPAVLQDWTANSEIHPGSNARNRMGFLASGSTLYAFANGKPLAGVEDDDYSFGTFGLFAAAAQTQDVEVTFDDFATWAISP